MGMGDIRTWFLDRWDKIQDYPDLNTIKKKIEQSIQFLLNSNKETKEKVNSNFVVYSPEEKSSLDKKMVPVPPFSKSPAATYLLVQRTTQRSAGNRTRSIIFSNSVSMQVDSAPYTLRS